MRRRLADLLLERALVSEELGDLNYTDELLSRLAVYDDGSHLAKWNEPASIEFTASPSSARATIARFGPRLSEFSRERTA